MALSSIVMGRSGRLVNFERNSRIYRLVFVLEKLNDYLNLGLQADLNFLSQALSTKYIFWMSELEPITNI